MCSDATSSPQGCASVCYNQGDLEVLNGVKMCRCQGNFGGLNCQVSEKKGGKYLVMVFGQWLKIIKKAEATRYHFRSIKYSCRRKDVKKILPQICVDIKEQKVT